jgi:urate oxidase
VSIVLGPHSYGKAETRVVRVTRGPDPNGQHLVEDLNVTTALSGDLADSHLTGDNTNVLPTDTQKNTVLAFARDGIGSPEDFGLRLARHFVHTQEPITTARVHLEQYGWRRIDCDGVPAAHSFRRDGSAVRTATVTHHHNGTWEDGSWIVSGVRDMIVLNTTNSEFWGFPRDRYTTLPETRERILATELNAQWRSVALDIDWNARYEIICTHLLTTFADTYSYALQQTAYAMGARVLEHVPEIVEIRLTLPNKHHYLVDLAPFGLDNPDQVYLAGDRPYGLIEAAVLRDEVAPAPQAW